MNRKRLLCTALALCVLLAACGKGGDAPDAPAPSDLSAGRYVEESLPLPAGLAGIHHMSLLSDGVLYLMGVRGGQLVICTSDDLGASWTDHDLPWLGEIEDYPGSAFAAAPGELYFMTRDSSGANHRLYRTDIATLVELDATTPQAAETQGGFKEILVTDGGDLLINCSTNLLVADGIEGRVRAEMPIGSVASGRVVTYGDYVLANRNGQIEAYALDTGDYLSGFSTDITVGGTRYNGEGGHTVMAPGDDRNGLYFMNTTGLFRSDREGRDATQLIDGTLTSLNLPRVNPVYLVSDGAGRFLLLASNTGEAGLYYLFRYTYDATLSAEPLYTLRLFTLEDNPTARQAAGVFQGENPDVKIVIEVGTNGGVTTSDALRTLSTELLAGRGPDILVLDGLPVESYIEQGVLADLTGTFGAQLDRGEFITDVAGAYRTGEGLFALTARFYVPVLLGRGVGGVHSLSDLVDLMEAGDLRDMGILRENLADRLYPALISGWLEGDELNTARLRADMADLRRLYERIDEVPEEDRWRPYRDTQGFVGLVCHMTMAGSIEVGYGNLGDFTQLGGTYTVVESGAADALVPFPSGGVYIPSTTVGINSRSGHIDIAEHFLGTMLGHDVLSLNFEDGFPTLRSALSTAAAAKPWAASSDMSGIGGYYHQPDTGEYAMVTFYFHWPEQGYIDNFISSFDDLHTPAPGNSVLQGLFVEEINAYMEGIRDLDDAVDAIGSKVAVYQNQ